MEQKIQNKLDDVGIERDYIAGNQTNNYISLYREEERKFVVTHHANIKPVYYFTGRETELNDLRQKIESRQKSVLVSGMGEIGKTHICRKLFEEYEIIGRSGSFRYIGYIEYNGDIGSSLQECLRYKEQERPEVNQEAAWKELEYLASDGKLLLFIDNVNKTIKEDPGLRRLNSIPGAIVLTSRRTSFGKEFEPYRIGFLHMEQCKEIYEKIWFENSEKKITVEETSDLEYIIEKLAARHTITIEFLARLAKTKSWTTEKLRRELEEKGFQLEYRDEEDELVNIQKSYETLYDMSGLTEAEQNILEAFSVFPYIPLSTEICNQWLLKDAEANEEDDILVGLYHKGWLQFDIEQKSYALHPVFAQFIYKKCRPVLEKHQGLIESCKMSLQIPKSGSALECQKYIPFAENIIEKIETREEIEKAGLMAELAYLLQYIAEYKKAEELYEKSLRIRKKIFGEEHPATAASYNNLAGVYKSQGEYQKAEELYKKSLRIKEKIFREEHPDTATSYNNLAGVYDNQGKYQRAEELYKKSLRITEKVFGEEHPATATSYNNLAGVYDSQGEYQKAEELYKKSLRIREKIFGEEHPATTTSYHNLAYMYQSQGEYQKAEELYKKSLRITEKIFGEEHPDTATSYNNLAGVYKSQGEYQRAKELYKKSLRIREKIFGEEHPATTTSYHNLAYMYQSQGEYQKAEELYKKSLRIREKIFGEEHPDTATSYNNLAYMYNSQGECRKAEELYKKSLRITEKIFGEEHPDTATSYNNLAKVYFDQNKYELALTYFIKAYKVAINRLGFEHPHTKIFHKNMKITYATWDPDSNFEQWLEEQMEKPEHN